MQPHLLEGVGKGYWEVSSGEPPENTCVTGAQDIRGASQVVKDPPASAGYIRYVSLFLGQEDSLEESMATYSSIPGEPHGQRNLVGYSPWGCKDSDTT